MDQQRYLPNDNALIDRIHSLQLLQPVQVEGLLELVDPYEKNRISLSEIVSCLGQYAVRNVMVEGVADVVSVLEKFADCCNIQSLLAGEGHPYDAEFKVNRPSHSRRSS